MDKHGNQAGKPYSKPLLTVYGTIRELTKAISNMGGPDNAAPGATRHKTGLGG
jgi:hypothetical protein